MTKKKNQHFVPQFYLRRFTKTSKSPYIDLFNCTSQKIISKAAIKKQASISNFYDNDNVVEDALSMIEEETAKCLVKIDKMNNLPKLVSERTTIIAFILFQEARTKSNGIRVDSNINKVYKRAFEGNSEIGDFLNNHKIAVEKPASFALRVTAKQILLAIDLKIKLINNETKQDFITSDNPVLKYNQFLENRKVHGGITGVGVKGIQYFFPIDSKKCLILYDGETYSIGSRFSNRIIIKSEKEIESINILQILNCQDNIYFNEGTNIEYIKSIYGKSMHFEKAGVTKVDKHPQKDNFMGNGNLIHSYTTDLKINLNLSFIRETKRAKKYKLGNKACHPRNKKFENTTVPNTW
ncbi:DUF4238 domain-containing protein [Labilibacter marinus]|uniref:DUF4238 domain-containing protein n=1 Tax=Labilibacter marinus TaxID=1477105 RepID=UPI000834B26C|nr:DUF4238 domain-containing protein [Labilibacter marinus]